MLKIETFTFSPFEENTYVVSDSDGKCFIIDPGCYDRKERKLLQAYILNNGLEPIGLLNTHCHIDHVFGNAFVHEIYGLKPQIHSQEIPMLEAVPQVAKMYGLEYTASPDPEIFASQTLRLGDYTFQILFVPGHSPGHVAFYQKECSLLFGGDVLFREGVGRTDLPGGNMETLMNSIKQTLLALPNETEVYAGHMQSTSIGFERANNPFLK